MEKSSGCGINIEGGAWDDVIIDGLIFRLRFTIPLPIPVGESSEEHEDNPRVIIRNNN